MKKVKALLCFLIIKKLTGDPSVWVFVLAAKWTRTVLCYVTVPFSGSRICQVMLRVTAEETKISSFLQILPQSLAMMNHNGEGTSTGKSALSESKDRTSDYVHSETKTQTGWAPPMGYQQKDGLRCLTSLNSVKILPRKWRDIQSSTSQKASTSTTMSLEFFQLTFS